MDVLSETMTRLCAEITALRQTRQELREVLKHGSQMRKAAMEEMCGNFTATRIRMGKKNGKERLAFLNNLRRVVNRQRQEMRTDLTDARAAWLGKAA